MKEGRAPLRNALAEWRRALGKAHVLEQSSVLRAYATATHATRHRVSAVLRPSSKEEVRACVRIARRWRIPLYPVSLGKNWGYGSRAPTFDGAVIIELRRMSRILEVNPALGYAVVEPGVSFKKLRAHLARRAPELIAPSVGSTPDASVIGNALERGLGFGTNGERCHSLINLEVVLGSGEVIQTGFGGIPGSAAEHVYRWGVGPSLDSVFFQSNFGIVTRGTLWLD